MCFSLPLLIIENILTLQPVVKSTDGHITLEVICHLFAIFYDVQYDLFGIQTLPKLFYTLGTGIFACHITSPKLEPFLNFCWVIKHLQTEYMTKQNKNTRFTIRNVHRTWTWVYRVPNLHSDRNAKEPCSMVSCVVRAHRHTPFPICDSCTQVFLTHPPTVLLPSHRCHQMSKGNRVKGLLGQAQKAAGRQKLCG